MLLHKKLTQFLLLLLCSITTSTLFADDYIIELLIFENLNRTGLEEQWLDKFQDSMNNSSARLDANWQSASSYQLNNAKAALKRSGTYRPLLHTAWRQTVSKKRRPVQLPENTLSKSAATVAGTVTVTKGRYLHLDLDLILQAEPDTTYIGTDYRLGSESNVIKLQQKRRMRSKELHYVDHPRLGVLALITPLESKN
jgi:hypothetical protein